jgi:hypothetical protein
MGRASLRYAAGTGTHRLDGERWCVGAMNAHALTVNSESTRPTGGYGNEVQGSHAFRLKPPWHALASAAVRCGEQLCPR